MENRPKIKIEPTTADRVLEIAGWSALAFLWIITLYNFKNLPAEIPTHFNGMGEVDAYGRRSTLLGLPIVGTVLFIGLTILNRFPHIFNYPVQITADNAARQYTLATRLMRLMKLSLVIIFILIVWSTTAVALEKAGKMSAWFLPVMLGIIFIPLAVYLYRSFRIR